MGMQDEVKLNRILSQLDDIRREVKSMMPQPSSAPKPVQVSAVPAPGKPPAAPEPKPLAQPREYEPSAIDRFWEKVEDWLFVRGSFAPKGVTHEFAVATRWLTRVGSVLLAGAVAYFLMLAIDKGWIGPAQRVYGMMAWGVAGTAFGTWLKLKSEKYAILGEVCAAVGLVAVYLSFGLGHRFFKPPVIASGYFAFAGLFAATVAAGVLSVRLRSLMIACLALAGGIVWRMRVSRRIGLALLSASVVKLLLFDTSSLATPGRVGVFAAVGVLLIAGAFLYLKFKSRFEE